MSLYAKASAVYVIKYLCDYFGPNWDVFVAVIPHPSVPKSIATWILNCTFFILGTCACCAFDTLFNHTPFVQWIFLLNFLHILICKIYSNGYQSILVCFWWYLQIIQTFISSFQKKKKFLKMRPICVPNHTCFELWFLRIFSKNSWKMECVTKLITDTVMIF